MKKVRIYVFTSSIPTVDFIDKEGTQHGCARAGQMPFEALSKYPGEMDQRYLSVEEKNTINSVESFCNKNGLQSELVDIAKLSFLSKIRLRMKGIKATPTICYADRFFSGIPTESDLKELVKS